MAKKVYLVDSTGYEFFICEFEGMGTDNRPRLTIMMPGRTVENFLTHLDYYGEDYKDYYLLGEEGKQVDATLVVEMMGHILIRGFDSFHKMALRMEEMRKNGISYGRDLQKLQIVINEVKTNATGIVRYRVDMFVGEDGGVLSDTTKYDDIHDIISNLRGFFYFIEEQMCIPLRKKLSVEENLKKQFKRYCPNVFDEID